jgi:hypothetical protein
MMWLLQRQGTPIAEAALHTHREVGAVSELVAGVEPP